MSANLKEALSLLRAGISVVPVQPGRKGPSIKWQPFAQTLPTEAQVRAWWKEWPTAGIAIVTGAVSNLVVIDVDDKARHVEDLLPETGVVVETGSGNRHYYYRHPGPGVRNAVGKDWFDVRGEGGIVVAPPSVHGSGNRYKWLSRDFKKLGRFPSDIAYAAPEPTETKTDSGDQRWLSEVLSGVSHGGRNDSATRLAGYYFKHNMPLDVVLQQLTIWNERNDPPLPNRDLKIIVESVKKRIDRLKKLGQPVRELEVDKPLFDLQPLSAYMEAHGNTEVEWAIKEWLPDKTIAMIVAPPGTFKTWLELDLAVSIASGRPFLGHYEVNRKGPVIVIQQEDFHGAVAERLGSIIYARCLGGLTAQSGDVFEFDQPPDLPIYVHPDRQFRFDDPEVLEAVEKAIDTIRPALVVIDPLYSTGRIDDFMVTAVAQMFVLKNWRDKYGCSFIVAHHTSKADKSKGSKSGPTTGREEAWGSQFLNAFLESGWQVRSNGDSKVIVRRHFKVSSNLPEIGLRMDIKTVGNDQRYRVFVEDTRDIALEDEPALLRMFSGSSMMTVNDLAEMTNTHRTTVKRNLDKLVAAEALEMVGDSHYRRKTH